jgi:hypothetical protein
MALPTVATVHAMPIIEADETARVPIPPSDVGAMVPLGDELGLSDGESDGESDGTSEAVVLDAGADVGVARRLGVAVGADVVVVVVLSWAIVMLTIIMAKRAIRANLLNIIVVVGSAGGLLGMLLFGGCFVAC